MLTAPGRVQHSGAGGSAPIAAQGHLTGVNSPDQGDYVRPQWGIYRSAQSAKSGILDTYPLFRSYTATKAQAEERGPFLPGVLSRDASPKLG